MQTATRYRFGYDIYVPGDLECGQVWATNAEAALRIISCHFPPSAWRRRKYTVEPIPDAVMTPDGAIRLLTADERAAFVAAAPLEAA